MRVSIEWPRQYAGAGIKVKSAHKKYVIAFMPPFPESDRPSVEVADSALTVLDAASKLPLGDIFTAATDILGDVVGLYREAKKIRQGRRIGAEVREVLRLT